MTSMNNLSAFRAKLAAGKFCVGTTINLTDATVSELAGEIGFDFTWIDMEHAPLTIETALSHIVALRASGAAPIVRVAWNQQWLIKPILDLAPAGIIVPMVNSAKEVLDAIAACRYPPRGVRGCGPRRGTRFGEISFDEYVADSENDPMVIVQFEHIEAYRHLDEILAIDELESVCIGPSDFSGSMGHVNDPFRPEIAAIIDEAAAKIKAAGKFLGTGTFASPENLAVWKRRGLDWAAVTSDWGCMVEGAKRAIACTRDIFH